MAKKKTNKTIKQSRTGILRILLKGFGPYLKNILPFSKTMLVPVFAQILGIYFILAAAALVPKALTTISLPEFISGNLFILLGLVLLFTIPGFFLQIKGFWEMMIRLSSLNIMAADAISGKTPDVASANTSIRNKTLSYAKLLTVLTLIYVILAGFPFLIIIFQGTLAQYQHFILSLFGFTEILAIIISLIVSIYLSLCLVVFAFEKGSTKKIIKRSWKLVSKRFFSMMFLIILSSIFVNNIIPAIVQSLSDAVSLSSALGAPIKFLLASAYDTPGKLNDFMSFFRTIHYNDLLASSDPLGFLSKSMASFLLGSVVSWMMIPLMSIWYTLFYFDITGKSDEKNV